MNFEDLLPRVKVLRESVSRGLISRAPGEQASTVYIDLVEENMPGTTVSETLLLELPRVKMEGDHLHGGERYTIDVVGKGSFTIEVVDVEPKGAKVTMNTHIVPIR